VREPVQRALEVLAMERQTENEETFPAFLRRLLLDVRELKGRREGELNGLRSVLLRLLARAGIALTEDDRARIQACDDAETLKQGENGLAVLKAAMVALDRLDREHAVVYFQIIYDVLREPMKRALEVLVMERQTENKATFPPFLQRVIDASELKGELKGLRNALLLLLARAGIALTDDERGRIQACDDAVILDRWVENVLGAKTAADVLS
jgi:hypothetical protein